MKTSCKRRHSKRYWKKHNKSAGMRTNGLLRVFCMLHAIFLNISFLSVWVTFLATLPVNVNSFITVYVLVDCCTSLRTEVVMRGNCCFSIKWFTVIECLLSVPCGSVTWNQKVIRWLYRFLPSTQWPPNTNHYKNSQYSICLHYDTYFLNCRVINDPSTCIKHTYR